LPGDAFPILGRLRGIGFCLVVHQFANALRRLVRIAGSWHHHLQLVPQPLAGIREIEVVAFERKTVRKKRPAAR
jgi:hypothetical protein